MPIILNCEGEPCPKPVLRCKQLLDKEKPDTLQVIVDNAAAKENVSRFLTSQGYRVDDVREDARLWTISASGAPQAAGSNDEPSGAACCPKILVFLTSSTIGHGDDTLGTKLMTNFLSTLPEMGDSLWRIIMVNGAVKLSTPENAALNVLQTLEKSGVSLLVCGTCLEFFGLTDQKQVGQVTNMLDIITSQQVADKIITL